MKKKYIQTGRVNQKLETREKILAGAQYFLNKGKHFTLDDVAKKAKISRATIYRYYSNTEILSLEAVLDINTISPETLYKNLEGKNLEDMLYGIQDYFNILVVDNENAFRKYLSVSIANDTTKIKRGARRTKALQLALENSELSQKDKDNLAKFLTTIMGIEPFIATKDVCGLNNEESCELLKWGLNLILKGLSVKE